MIDVSLLMEGKDLESWMSYEPGADVLIKYLTDDVCLDMRDRCLNGKGKVDERKLRFMMAEEAIIDWRGFKDGKKDLVCNKKNIKIMLSKLTAFALWVQTMATEYTVLQRFKLAEEKKRSGSGSGQEKHTKASPAKAVKTSRKKTK